MFSVLRSRRFAKRVYICTFDVVFNTWTGVDEMHVVCQILCMWCCRPVDYTIQCT